MQEADIQFPDVNYGENNKEKYNELVDSEWSPFFNHPYWEIFVFCMSYAYAKKLPPSEPTGKGTLNAKVFLPPTRYLMRALAIAHDGDLSIIKDSNKVVKICERFANAGIEEVHHRFEHRTSDKPIESVFLEMINEINKERD